MLLLLYIRKFDSYKDIHEQTSFLCIIVVVFMKMYHADCHAATFLDFFENDFGGIVGD